MLDADVCYICVKMIDCTYNDSNMYRKIVL